MKYLLNLDDAVLIFLWIMFTFLFLFYPSLDISVSTYFYDAITHTFPYRHINWVQHANNLGRGFMFIVMGFPLAVWLKSILFRKDPPFSLKEMVFFLGFYIFSFLILIEYVVKQLWLRPRPDQTVLFGGTKPFLPIFHTLPTGDFHSFVSGHAAVWFSLICIGYTLYPEKKRLWTGIAICTGLLMGLGRIIIGKHYLSDVIFSGLFISTSCFILDAIRRKIEKSRSS